MQINSFYVAIIIISTLNFFPEKKKKKQKNYTKITENVHKSEDQKQHIKFMHNS